MKCVASRPRRPSPAQQEQLVKAWNDHNPIGVQVRVTDDRGKVTVTRTRSLAWMMGGHTAMILLEGVSGGYMLERCAAAGGEP